MEKSPRLQLNLLAACYAAAGLPNTSSQDRLRDVVNILSNAFPPQDSIYLYAYHQDADEFSLVAENQSSIYATHTDLTNENGLFSWRTLEENHLTNPAPGSGVYFAELNTTVSFRNVPKADANKIIEECVRSALSKRTGEKWIQTLDGELESAIRFRSQYIQKYYYKTLSDRKSQGNESEFNITLHTTICYFGEYRSSHTSLHARTVRRLSEAVKPTGMIFINRIFTSDQDQDRPRLSRVIVPEILFNLGMLLNRLVDSARHEAVRHLDLHALIRGQEDLNHVFERHIGLRDGEADERNGGQLVESLHPARFLANRVFRQLLVTALEVTRGQVNDATLYAVYGENTVQRFSLDADGNAERIDEPPSSRETSFNLTDPGVGDLLQCVRARHIVQRLETSVSFGNQENGSITIFYPIIHDRAVRAVLELRLKGVAGVIRWQIFQWLPYIDMVRHAMVQLRRRVQRESLLHFSQFWLARSSVREATPIRTLEPTLTDSEGFKHELAQLVKAIGANQAQVITRDEDGSFSGFTLKISTKGTESVVSALGMTKAVRRRGLTAMLLHLETTSNSPLDAKRPIAIVQHILPRKNNSPKYETFAFCEDLLDLQLEELRNGAVPLSDKTVKRDLSPDSPELGSVKIDGIAWDITPNAATTDRDFGGIASDHTRVGFSLGSNLVPNTVIWLAFQHLCDFTWSEQNLVLLAARNIHYALWGSVAQTVDRLMAHEFREWLSEISGPDSVWGILVEDRVKLAHALLSYSQRRDAADETIRCLMKTVLSGGNQLEQVIERLHRNYFAEGSELYKRTVCTVCIDGARATWRQGMRVALPELMRNIAIHAPQCRSYWVLLMSSADSCEMWVLNSEASKDQAESGVESTGIGTPLLRWLVLKSGGRFERVQNSSDTGRNGSQRVIDFLNIVSDHLIKQNRLADASELKSCLQNWHYSVNISYSNR